MIPRVEDDVSRHRSWILDAECGMRFLSWSGIVRPAVIGAPQVAGMIMVATGTAIALWRMFVRGG